MPMPPPAALDPSKIIRAAAPASRICKLLPALLTPAPLRISSPPTFGQPGQYGEMFNVKAAESEMNTMLFASTEVETFTTLCDDSPKLATSDGPLGGPPAVQLLGFSQAESCGDDSQ